LLRRRQRLRFIFIVTVLRAVAEAPAESV
jgi:hypothetical protein